MMGLRDEARWILHYLPEIELKYKMKLITSQSCLTLEQNNGRTSAYDFKSCLG